MKEHILLDRAKRYEIDVVSMPDNCTYLPDKGYWEDNDTGEPMMFGENPQRCQTKKADVETGEDQKGE